MTRDELIVEIEDMLMLDEGELNLDVQLDSYEDWDSMSYLALIALSDSKLNKKLEIETIKGFKTANDILKFANL